MKTCLTLLTISLMALSCGYDLPSEEKIPLRAGELSFYRVEGNVQTNVDSLLREIDMRRVAIEEACDGIEPVILTKEDITGKTWGRFARVEVYPQKDVVLRIKAYQPENGNASSREYYFRKDQVELVVIERDAAPGRGKPIAELDRVIYLHNGDFILEMGRHQDGDRDDELSDLQDLQNEAATFLQSFYQQGTTVP